MMSLWPSLSRFEIRHPLGKGGSGNVYLALDRKLDQEVALKLIPFSSAPNSMLQLERNGALYQQKLAEICPQVPVVFDFGDENGYFWISMEHIDGIDLADELCKGPFPVTRAIYIALQLCELLMKMHEFPDTVGGQRKLGVVHGDIKPGNIRLQSNDRVRVIDFGISKQLSLFRPTTEAKFGSLPYIPPEQLQKDALNRGSDLWAVGVVLYEMISGSVPFRGNTKEEMVQEFLAGNILPLPTGKPEDLRWIIYKCLYPKPGKRFSSAAELREELLQVQKKLLSHETTEVRRLVPDISDTPTPPLPAPSPPQEENAPRERPNTEQISRPETPKPKRISRIASPFLLLFIILVAGSQTFLWWQAKELRTKLLDSSTPDVNLIWSQYQKLQQFDPLKIVHRTAGTGMRDALTSSASQILVRYSEDDSTVNRKEWETAHRYFTAVQELGFSSPQTHSRIAFCLGHLALSEAHKDGDKEHEKLQEAVHHFRQASGFDAQWPDPYVGLARIYGYELLDLNKLSAALKEAKHLGYPNIRRLTAYEADAHRKYGWELSKRSLKVEAEDRKRELLEEAIYKLDYAIKLYKNIPDYANSERNLLEAKDWKGITLNRLSRLEPSIITTPVDSSSAHAPP